MKHARTVQPNRSNKARLAQIEILCGCLMIIALVACVASPARADLVSGRVYVDGKPWPDATCTIDGNIEIHTDKNGAYRVSLSPGPHQVQCTVNGVSKAAGINASSQPVQQDIPLQ